MEQININISDTHPTVINWLNQVNIILDGYRNHHSISHGVQKDAIQNSWDARLDKKTAKGWEVTFELIETNKITLFSFTDKSTTGLTGRILMPKDLEEDLSIEERWGRFENVAFTKKPSEHALGARGRGKFIFVGASNFRAKSIDKKEIHRLLLYDTLRNDGIYRFGFRTITLTDSPIQAFEGIEGEIKLKELTNNKLEPIKQIGTRVIIVNPISELIENIKNGNFMEFINETWWEIIKNYNAKIQLKIGDTIYKARLLKYFKFPSGDSNRFKIYTKKNIKLPQAPNYLIKNIQIVYDTKNNIPEDVRGISIQRGGMKVCSIPIRYIDKSIADSIYGYINFETSLEEKLLKHEGIEHYSFDFKKLIPRLVRQFIEEQIDKFIRDKLGINVGTKIKTYEKDKSAELKALYQLNNIAKELGILGKGITTVTDPSQEFIKKIIPVRLIFCKFDFPAKTLRVNYGEEIKNINLQIKNNTDTSKNIGVRFSILHEEDEIMIFINNEQHTIPENKTISLVKNNQIKISQDAFIYKGKYTFQSKLVSLDDKNRGETLHTLTKNFWVEENPPQKGIYEEIIPYASPEETKTILGFAQRTDGNSYKYYYNNLHPAKKAVADDEDKLMNYLIEIGCLELARIDLINVDHKIFSPEDLEKEESMVRRLNKFIGEIKYKLN